MSFIHQSFCPAGLAAMSIITPAHPQSSLSTLLRSIWALDKKFMVKWRISSWLGLACLPRQRRLQGTRSAFCETSLLLHLAAQIPARTTPALLGQLAIAVAWVLQSHQRIVWSQHLLPKTARVQSPFLSSLPRGRGCHALLFASFGAANRSAFNASTQSTSSNAACMSCRDVTGSHLHH